ncbi:MAG: hypothetical protein RL387_1852 [Bacteroidota bacterium]|jgi:hypothetical protein
MATIADLFKNQEKDLYENEIVRIESRGLVNPPRAAALLASSPNAIGDVIGGQLAGIIGGSANRPSDTIYKGKTFIDKPVSITGVTEGLLKNSVEAGTNYYVKREPSSIPGIGPVPPLFGKSAPGGSTTAGTIANQAIKAINTLGGKKAVQTAAQKLKEKATVVYGPIDGKPVDDNVTNSKYKEVYSEYKNDRTGRTEYISTELVKRKPNDNWDLANTHVQEATGYNSLEEYNNTMKQFANANQVIVLFKKYGNKTVVPFVGAISGISEDIQPEWNGFKYIGSPFKVYRYNGVERSLKFNLKLYYFTEDEKWAMIQKVNYLKSLTFPYESVSEITYGESKGTAQYAFSPNLLYVTLGDMYKNVFGYMESLSFSVDDNTTWPNFEPNGVSNGKNADLYPSVIEVNISIKIIENHLTEKDEKSGTTTYRYNFDGRGKGEYIPEVKDDVQNNADYSTPSKPNPKAKLVRGSEDAAAYAEWLSQP